MTSTEDLNRSRFLEHLERCVNGRDFGAMTEYYAPDFTSAGCAGQPSVQGPEAETDQLKAMAEAFPDFRYDVQSIVAEGDSLAVTARFRGTHRGEFMGVDPTGRSVDVPFVDVLRFRDGMMVEYWGVFDSRELSRRLGDPTSSDLSNHVTSRETT